MKSVMQHDFSKIPQANIPRSVFNRTHGHKTTFDAGYLVPLYVDEALPGDTLNVNATVFARMTTPIYPLMDNMVLDVHYFAVPLRLIWTHAQAFMGEQTDPLNPTEYYVPQIVAPAVTGWTQGSLSDYFGLPTGVASLTQSSLWHRAYNLIWNEWYRSNDLQTKAVVDVDDGPDSPTDYVLRKRGKRHDYFTSCLPWPQRGPSVPLPLGDEATVVSVGDGYPKMKPEVGTAVNGQFYGTVTTNNVSANMSLSQSSLLTWHDPGLKVDLTDSTAASINALRQAFQLQRLYERDARGGARYVELLRSHFGVVSPDFRLARPEFLGSGSSKLSLHPIAQTSRSDAGNEPLGTLAATGVIAGKSGFTKSFTEHCVILGLMSVRADLTYQQGLPRMFSRLTRWDFYWPGLAHLGEQAVYQKEIFCNGTPGVDNDDKVFGYQERWAEYRYYPSKITGQMRSTFATPLDAWHLSQEFAEAPTLSDAFIQENPPMARVLAIADAPHFICDSYIQIRAARPMPVYSVPGLIDHF